jgi:hypothetical protein
MNEKKAPWFLGVTTVALLFLRAMTGPAASPYAGQPTPQFALPAPSSVQDGATPLSMHSWAPYVRVYDDFFGTQPAREHTSVRIRGTLAQQQVELRLGDAGPAGGVTYGSREEEGVAGLQDLDRIAHAARAGHYRPEFLIALVPDPIDSRLPSNFDFTITGLQLGLNQSLLNQGKPEDGYLFDRGWHPWTAAAVASGDAYGRPAHLTAGIMLFHKAETKGETTLLTVFLIGETPKGGIHRQAFEQAVRFIMALEQAFASTAPPAAPGKGKAHPDATPPAAAAQGNVPPAAEGGVQSCKLRVLGPSFSGSAGSLNAAMRLLLDSSSLGSPAPCGFSVVSGSATSPELATEVVQGDARIVFDRTVVPDDYLRQTALCYFEQKLGWNLSQTALLVEGDTAYGQGFSPPGTNGNCLPQDPRIQCVHPLPFPSGVSAIRNAWEEGGEGRTSEVARAPGRLPAAAVPKTALEISLADRGTPADSILELSPLTSRIEEMAMASLLRAISRYDIRYVGIVATDVKDEIFLAQQVRRWAPDVTIFLLESNLAYLHPHFHPALFGSLVVSSFPVFTNEVPTNGAVQPQFGDETQEGIFLAVRKLLGQNTDQPAVWIAATGNDTLSPLARLQPLDAGAKPGTGDSCQPARASGKTPEGQAQVISFPEGNDLQLLFLMEALWLLVLCLRNAVYLEGAVPAPDSTRSMSAGPRQLLVLGEFVLCTMGAGIVALACLPVFGNRYFVDEASPLWHIVFLGATAGFFGWLLISPLARKRADTKQASKQAGAKDAQPVWRGPWGLWLAGGTLAVAALVAILLLRTEEPGFLYLRMRRFANGLSPLVSLGWLGGALLVWISCELRRQQLRERHHLSWPIPEGAEIALSGCTEVAGSIAGLLERSLPTSRRFWWAVLATMLPTAALLWKNTQPLADPRWYGWIFVGLALVVLVLCAVSFYRFGMAWLLLRHLLQRLEHCRCRRSFASLTAIVQWNPMQSFVWYAPSFRSLVQSVERLEELGRKAGELVRREAEQAAARLQEAFRAEAEGRFADEVEARQGVSRMVDEVAQKLAGEGLDLELQDLRALRTVAYLRQVFVQLRYALMGATVPGLLSIAALSTYTFVPRRFMLLLFWTALLTGSGLSLIIFVQIDRDAVLSEIGNRPPGKVTLERAFLSNVFTYAVIPLLALVSSQLPEVSRVLGHWLDPLQRLLEVG